jgi:hypothetical protein
MTDLSPAAQAVLDHFLADCQISTRHGIAAALRAAADQVVPAAQSTEREEGPLVPGDRVWDDRTASICRHELLSIANGLDPQP